jgi:hypothetical protein
MALFLFSPEYSGLNACADGRRSAPVRGPGALSRACRRRRRRPARDASRPRRRSWRRSPRRWSLRTSRRPGHRSWSLRESFRRRSSPKIPGRRPCSSCRRESSRFRSSWSSTGPCRPWISRWWSSGWRSCRRAGRATLDGDLRAAFGLRIGLLHFGRSGLAAGAGRGDLLVHAYAAVGVRVAVPERSVVHVPPFELEP